MRRLLFCFAALLLSYTGWGQFATTSLPKTWDQYPSGIQKRGFGLHASQLVQMDSDPGLEDVLLFSAHNGHYPYFDLFKNYYVILDHYSKEVQYTSSVTISTERDILLEDRDKDGKYELYREYFKDDAFTVDEEGNHLDVEWFYDTIEFDKKVVVAYVTSWKEGLPDPSYVTHINYAFGHVTDSFDGVRIDNEERLQTIVDLKKQYPSLEVMLSIGGWGSGRFSEMAAEKENRERFAADCQRVVEQFGLDGIDIDWEYPTSDLAKISASPDDTANFTLLMKDIRNAIGPHKLLTLATVASGEYINFRDIMPYTDFVNIMAYDMGMPPNHHSALYRSKRTGNITSEEAVDAHLKAGVPLDKLVMGMPLYGKGDRDKVGDVDYKSLLRQTKYEVKWDEDAKVSYLVNSRGQMIYTFETPESIALKCQFILDRGLRGGMYWSYESDDEEGAMIKTIYNILRTQKP